MSEEVKQQDEAIKMPRKADEIFVHMNKDFRISRNTRAHWFFDHINQEISIDRHGNASGKEMSVMGIVPSDSTTNENVGNEKFVVAEDTKVVYISRFYRQVYVLDFSPSVIVADMETDSCIYNKLLECLRASLTSVTKPFTIPGTAALYNPQIYVSIIVFVPFLAFEEDLTLVNSVLLTSHNVDTVLADVQNKFTILKTKLYKFSRPVMQKWGQLRRRHKSRLDSTCQNDPSSSNSDLSSGVVKSHTFTYNYEKLPRQIITLPSSIFAIPKRIFDSESAAQRSKQVHTVEAKEEGYIVPELALLFMLRLGLTVIQTMPENTQSNVIIVTDGVAGMAAPEALQAILRELRSFTVSCSFIELKGKSKLAPCFGHVTSGELFHFLATATFGGYLPIDKISQSLVPETTPRGFQPLNRFHRALLCWSFQNALLENEHIARAINEINSSFAKLYKIKRDYDVHMNETYTTTLKELLYVRLREGFTVKKVALVDDRIKMLLALPFRPGTFLEYGIDAPWPATDRREDIHVDVVVSGPESEVRDLKISKTTEGVYRANALRVSLVNSLEDACRRVIEADTVLLHIHSFNTHTMYYSLPPGAEVFPLYHYGGGMKKDKDDEGSLILVPKFQPRGTGPFSNFLRFWKIVCHMRHEEWQKWVHVHYERAILHCRPRGNICLENNNEERWACRLPRQRMHKFLMKMSSFCLIKDELYVVFVTKTVDMVPSFFYMIRVYEVIPYVVFKIAFLGGICSTERRMLVSKFKKMLSQMTYCPNGSHHEQKVLVVMKRPLERLLILYDELPKNIFLTQWTIGKEDTPLEKPLRIENERHNAIAKYLEGRRHVWKFPLSVLNQNALGNYGLAKRVAEICTNCLLQKRLHEGYRVAWMKNMIIGLCRQVEVRGRCTLEQYIMFQPSSKTYLESEKIITGSTKQAGFILVAESWCEPCLAEEEQSPRALLDDDLVVCIYTVNHLLSICSFLASPTTLNNPLAKEKDGRLVTSRVSSVDCPFNLHTLLRHSRRLLLHLPIFELADDDDWAIRNAIFSSSLFDELADYSSIYLDIQDPTTFARIFTQLLMDKGDERRVNLHSFKKQGYDEKYMAKCRVFIKHASIYSITVFIVPAVNVLPENERNWPVVTTVCEESLTTYSIIRNCPHNRVFEYSLNRSSMGREDLDDFPHEYDLNDSEIQRWVSDRDVPVMRVNYRQIRIKPMVEEMQKAVVQRAMVSALFKCLKMGKGAAVDREDINFILDEICDYTNVELQGVPHFISCFCSHLTQPPKKDHGLCEVSHFQNIFNDALKENCFNSVPANPVYFFFNPPKELYRRSSTLAEVPPEDLQYPLINFPTDQSAAECPLFIFFHCALNLPGGEEEYVPVNYLPSCVNQVLQTAGKNIEVEELSKIKIKLLMYVLTWPKRQQIKEVKEDVDSDDTDFSGRGKKFIRKLPFQERGILRDTMHTLNHFLELECLLTQNTDQPVSLEHLQNLSRFITRTVGKGYCDIRETEAEKLVKSKKNLLTKRIRQRFRNLKFVIHSTHAFHTLVERLDMKPIDYCILRKVEGANIFYIRKIENRRAYEMFFKRDRKKEGKRHRTDSNSSKQQLLSRTESEVSILSTSGSLEYSGTDLEKMVQLNSDNSCTFWVILSIEKMTSVVGDEEIRVKLQFCERYAAEPSHSRIYSSTWNEMRAEIRRINQEILLKNMYSTSVCSPFLLTKEERDVEKSSDRRTFSETTEEDDELDLSMAHTAFYDFAPGSLACPLVWEKWFEIHPRLRRKHPFGPLHEAAVTLRRSLEQYMVNIPNTFVFQSEDGYILYGQIYSSYEQFSKSGKSYKLGLSSEVKEKVKAKFTGNDKTTNGKAETSLLFVGFGVSRPTEAMVRLISEGLIEKKITNMVMETLVEIYKKNPRAMLESYDVEFIQPDNRRPSMVYYFSIPAVMSKFTSAVRLYYLQHMSQFDMYEARVREGTPGAHSHHRPFYSYPYVLLPGQTSNPKYDPQFHLLNIYKKEGRSHSGIAVIELRIITEDGLIDKPHDGLLRLESHNSLCPPLEDQHLFFDWFERATTTYCEAVENPKLSPEEHPRPPTLVQDACGYVQAIVWQVGDVGLAQLQQILTDVVEGAFLDVLTEYGMLNQEIIGTVATHTQPPPTSPSATTPQKVRTPSSASKLSSGRKRDSTDIVHSSLTSLSTSAININADQKRGSSVFVYDHGSRRGSNHELSRDDFVLPMMRNTEYISFSFKQTIESWFEYIQIRRSDQRDDYRKQEYELRHSVLVPQTLNQIETQLRELLSNPDHQLSDKVQLFQHANRGSDETPRYDLLSGPLKDDILCDALANDVHPRFVLTAYCQEVHCNTRRYGYEIAKNPQDAPSVLAKLADQYKECKWLFLPILEETFVPRQTFLLLKEHNNRLTLYAYNLLPSIYYDVADMILRVVMWQNAKYRLYEHILENPLDPVLPPVDENDKRTENNPYTQMIGADPDILITKQAPPKEFENFVSVPISAEIASRLFRVRKTYTAQVPHACKFQRTFQKFREMRKEVKQQVEDYQSNKVMYDDLTQGMTEVTEHQLSTMWAHSRRVHYVQTPVLLSPAWRRKIAQVRRGTMDTPPQKVKPPTPSSLTSTHRSRAPTSSSLSLNRQITFPSKSKEEDELFDPCHVKMLHDLTLEYVNYLKSLGLSLLNVSNATEESVAAHRYKMEYPQGGRKPPDVCLFKQLLHGVLLVRLHFVPPYFIMSVGMWAAPELLLRDQQLTERDSKKYLSDLETVKDMLVAKCHIHSFTYDFHLRMISRYLIHKEILFPNGYNTSTFLIDFLKYYACRPPSARNCVYEERTAFNLHKNVNSCKVWECFLEKNYEEKYCWRVLRIRITDEETDPSNTRANEYMLVSNSDVSQADGHAKICVLLRDKRRKETDGYIYLAQYMILVNQEKNNPLEEARQREESSKSNVGEFRSVPVPTEEQMNREVDDMMMLIQEGGLPTVEGKVMRRRRFNSGGHTPPLQINTSGDTDNSLHSPVALHSSESDVNVPVQGDPTLRHRKTAESSEEGEIPNEKANYIQYISVGQRKLQQLLESTTLEYSEIINEAVEEANKECLREFLWCSVHSIPSPVPQLPKLGHQVRLGTSVEIWNSLRGLQHESGQHIIELCQLVSLENMKKREPRLNELLANTNCARLCRFLVYRFGVMRCRFFESTNPHPKPVLRGRLDTPPDIVNGFFVSPPLRHLLITNPDNPIVFLVRCEHENQPDLIILFKKDVNQLDAHFASLLDKAFDELVQSVTAFLWSDLIYRPPGKST